MFPVRFLAVPEPDLGRVAPVDLRDFPAMMASHFGGGSLVCAAFLDARARAKDAEGTNAVRARARASSTLCLSRARTSSRAIAAPNNPSINLDLIPSIHSSFVDAALTPTHEREHEKTSRSRAR